MKKLSLLIISFIIISLFSTVSASSTASGYTMEDLQKLAIDNSRQTTLDDLDIQAKEKALKEARDDAALLGYTTDLTDNINKDVKPMEAKTDLDIANMTKQDNMESLKLSVYKAVLNILLVQKEVEKEQEKLIIFQDRYNVAKAKYGQKIITADDLSSAEYNLNSKNADLTTVKGRLSSAYLELNKLLNKPLDMTATSLACELAKAEFKELDINNVVTDALKADTSIYQMEQKLAAAQKTMDWTVKSKEPGDDTYDSNNLSLETAKIDLEDGRITLETNIRNKYNDVLTQNDKVGLADRYLKLMEKRMTNAKTKYDKGLISKDEYNTQRDGYLDASYQKYQAIYSFNVTLAEFKNMTSDIN